MSEDTTVSFSLEVNVGKALDDVRRLQTVLSRSLALVRKASGSEDLNNFIDALQKAIAWINKLRLALHALQAARMAAGDPLAWAMAGIAVVEVGADVMMEVSSYG